MTRKLKCENMECDLKLYWLVASERALVRRTQSDSQKLAELDDEADVIRMYTDFPRLKRRIITETQQSRRRATRR